ncbi:IclR family transcriptional regulator [Oceaniglobus trochenteri]|uniref:IclR family transcriptional regulator n=1 Tax=Oceaniglobus trochenteri TaxID=2763260 RepID=UPI001CFFB2E0|nr:IclR family transcriptional regulator [Oceaniglobus trochenteri]
MNQARSTEAKPRKAGARAEYSSPAVDKAVDIIEFLASQGESVSITAIADGLERSVGEIYRIVLALEQRRVVSRDESNDRFRLSLRLFELANRFPPVERLVQVARVEMDALARRARQSCHLAVAEVREITVVATRESPLPMRYSVRMGSSFDMFETSSGVVIAAFSSEVERQQRLKFVKPAARAALEERFERVRAQGYEMRESLTVSGLSNISVPVHSQQGKILAALTVPYLEQTKATLEPEGVLALQIAASARMTKGLG